MADDIARAFGEANRKRLLRQYFEAAPPVTANNAWEHVYHLLLWIDRTIGLAHCYESDKCQPGRPWYARSLGFHSWLSRQFDISADELGEDVDWLFTQAVRDLSATAEARLKENLRRADEQRRQYQDDNMPLPGEDLELESIIRNAVSRDLGIEPPTPFVRRLSKQIQAYSASENKRKNLVGEGFEDTLARILSELPSVSGSHSIRVRPVLQSLPGFFPPRGQNKTRKVDLALIRNDGYRVLVSCKWSVRSDREEQFSTDFEAYASLESSGQTFDYVLITNEFDPARLAAACENRTLNAPIFTKVVHVNTDGLRAAYDAPLAQSGRARAGQDRAFKYMDSGRLMSLDRWLSELSS